MHQSSWFRLCALLAVLAALLVMAACATTRPSQPAAEQAPVILPTVTPMADQPAAQPAAQPADSEAAQPAVQPAAQPAGSEAADTQADVNAAADTAQGLPYGIGIMGDSFYDEYQGSDRRGGEYAAVTFNLVELLVRLRGFDLGPWGVWGEPRREGYEYNWARSSANSNSMISDGQHTGLAEQVAAGKVGIVFIGIGANDFAPYHGDTYKSIYEGRMSDDDLAAKITGAVRNVTLAVDTVQQAGAQQVAITLFTQWELDPTIANSYPDADRRRRVADAIDAVNTGLQAMAAERGVVVVDQNAMGNTILPQLDSEGFLNVGGERIDFLHNGDEPHHVRLGDGQHLGTVMSGLTANYYFVDTFTQHFGLSIPPLTDEEILRAAGLRP